MTAELEIIHKHPESSINVSIYNRKNFDKPRGIHYHPEFEIIYINGGSGNRLIRNKYARYTNGDLLFIGPNMLHHGIEDSVHAGFDQIVIQFRDTLFTDRLHGITEFRPVMDLLSKAKGVLVFDDRDKHLLGSEIIKLADTPADQRVFGLMIILKKMSEFNYAIEFPEYNHSISDYDRSRLTDLMNYFNLHIESGLSLEEASRHFRITKSSLCRFVRRAADKTFSELLNEYRISRACELLNDQQIPITEIALRSGYASLSNFNHHFRRIVQMAPREYRSKVWTDHSPA